MGKTYSRAALWGYAAAAVVFVGGAFAVVGGYLATRDYEETQARLRFAQRAAEVARVFLGRVKEETMAVDATVALFRASHEVEADEFATFTRTLLMRPDLRALGWVPRVSRAGRADFESSLGAGKTVTEWRDDEGPSRAPDREEYFPIRYVEPRTGNEIAVGFDLASDETRRDALRLSRDTGVLAVAGPLRFVEAPLATFGYLLVLPCYRGAPVTVQERREALQGVVVGRFDPKHALSDTMSYPVSHNMHVEIVDGESVVAEYGPRANATQRGAGTSVYEVSLPFGDRSLLFRAYRGSDEQAAWGLLPIVALMAGAFAALSGSLYLTSLATTMERQRKTQRALQDAQMHYRTLVDRAPEAIVVIDPETMRCVDTNPTARSMLKLTEEQFRRLGPADLSPPVQPDGRPSAETVAVLIQRAASGEDLTLEWVFRDAEGRDVECEVRLGRISVNDKTFVRGSALDVSDRRRAEERRVGLMRELDHRVKNTLSTVLALATQTANSSTSLDTFLQAFDGRLRALARAHEALATRGWRGASIHELATLVLGPYRAPATERIRLAGPPTTLTAEAASALAMVLNELATNAAKYGALFDAHGHVDLGWYLRVDGTLVLEWRERGGPTPGEPATTGFGMRLIRGLVEHELAGTLEVDRHADGLGYRITGPAEHVVVPTTNGSRHDQGPDDKLVARGA